MNYVIWSYEHQAWWKPASRGYTTELIEAGWYTAEEAGQIVMDSVMVEEIAMLETLAERWGPPKYHPYNGEIDD